MQNLSQCYYIHHKSHMEWNGINPRCPRGETVESLHNDAVTFGLPPCDFVNHKSSMERRGMATIPARPKFRGVTK